MSELRVALDRYLRHVSIERGLSQNTVAAYRRDLGQYLVLLQARGITAPGEVSSADVTAFSAELRTGHQLTASSTARMLSSVRGFHRFLLDEGLVAVDVAVDTKPPKLASRIVTPQLQC